MSDDRFVEVPIWLQTTLAPNGAVYVRLQDIIEYLSERDCDDEAMELVALRKVCTPAHPTPREEDKP